MSGLVEGQRALVVGVANKRSIAWSIARALDAQGARVALTYQNERTERDVRRLADELSGDTLVVPWTSRTTHRWTPHSTPWRRARGSGRAGPRGGLCAAEDLTGRFTEISREGFALAWTSRRSR